MDTYIGTILYFAGNFVPKGWLACSGQLLPINQNQALFSILGTQYGGDGKVTFALPNLPPLAPKPPLSYGVQAIICVMGVYPPHP